MKVFYGINDNIIKRMINNCENFVKKLKSVEEQKYYEEETIDENSEDKINTDKNSKNKKMEISYNSNINYGFEKKNNGKASNAAIFFIR